MTHVRINRSLMKWPPILCTYLSFSQFIVLLSSSCGFPLHPSPFIRQEILRELNVDQQLTSTQLFLMDRSSSQWPLTLPAHGIVPGPRNSRRRRCIYNGHLPSTKIARSWPTLSSSTLPQNPLELRGCHISPNQFWRSLAVPGRC
jgi:hypothetical protein